MISVEIALRRVLCAAAIVLSNTAYAQPVLSGQAEFEQAMIDYERQHFVTAFEVLSRLADAGHPEAARIALLMCANGMRLYGQKFEADAARRSVWLAHAATTSSPKVVSRWGDFIRAQTVSLGSRTPAPD